MALRTTSRRTRSARGCGSVARAPPESMRRRSSVSPRTSIAAASSAASPPSSNTPNHAAGERVTRFNGLFHWAVPPGREIEAGRQVGRFHIITHCYWREGGPEFNNVNIMAVAHGDDKEQVLAHKAAIDAHLDEIDIPVPYTNVFWGGRSEIKPTEISPVVYREWARKAGVL